MKNSITIAERLEIKICAAIREYHSHILNPIEQELVGQPKWKFVRSKLLTALGDRGMLGSVRKIIQEELKSEMQGGRQ